VTQEYFELELIGGGMERRYRRMRPDIEALPWGTFDTSKLSENVVLAARKSWTGAAFQEHRTGAACAATLKALVEARAPLDLIALASRFPLDEIAHVEICSRLAMELGGGTTILHDPDHLIVKPREDCDSLVRCADLVVRFFCVGEAFSIPLLRGAWHTADHPLVKGALGIIVRDEAAHGAFGWSFLDWALPEIDPRELESLAAAADRTIDSVKRNWEDLRGRPPGQDAIAALGWMRADDYVALAISSLERRVLVPFRRRGVPIESTSDPDARVYA
jgi:hypothetical protein